LSSSRFFEQVLVEDRQPSVERERMPEESGLVRLKSAGEILDLGELGGDGYPFQAPLAGHPWHGAVPRGREAVPAGALDDQLGDGAAKLRPAVRSL
jgi:hypothetical protein